MINLFSDIAEICIEQENFNSAFAHLYLDQVIRVENKWTVSEPLRARLDQIKQDTSEDSLINSKSEAIRICKEFWKQISGHQVLSIQKKKKDLIGKIRINEKKTFGFINTHNNMSAICFLKDAPKNLKDNDKVKFDAVPSFDKKKNKESWKAENIRKL